MFKKSFYLMMSFVFLLILAACGDNVEEEIDVVFEALSEDQSADALVSLLEVVYDKKEYEEELAAAQNEASKTISTLRGLELSTKEVEELRDLYVSSIEDFQTIIEMIEANAPDVSEEQWSEIEKVSKEANEKQMKLIEEKLNRMDAEMPEELGETEQ
ncbi:hypothetical protein GN156_06820 [bacterium LRH843]|nr:hypothetical protein [bacterium LRH843]